MAAMSVLVEALIHDIKELDPSALSAFMKNNPEIVCPHSNKIMRNPVKMEIFGQTWEEEALRNWMKTSENISRYTGEEFVKEEDILRNRDKELLSTIFKKLETLKSAVLINNLITDIEKLDSRALGLFIEKNPETVCPRSKKIMRNPVKMEIFGQTWEEEALRSWMKTPQNISRLTGEEFVKEEDILRNRDGDLLSTLFEKLERLKAELSSAQHSAQLAERELKKRYREAVNHTNPAEAEKIYASIIEEAKRGTREAEYFSFRMHARGHHKLPTDDQAIAFLKSAAKKGYELAIEDLKKLPREKKELELNTSSPSGAAQPSFFHQSTPSYSAQKSSYEVLKEGRAHEKAGKYLQAMECFQSVTKDNLYSLTALEGCYHLARMYEDNHGLEGVEDNEKEKSRWIHAQYWYSRTLELFSRHGRGNRRGPHLEIGADAKYRLGRLYEQKLAHHGPASIRMSDNTLISCNLEKPDDCGYDSEDNIAIAAQLYEEAAKYGHADAMYRLGRIKDKGGQPQSANEWYKRAADRDHEGALHLLLVALHTSLENYITQVKEKKSKSISANWFNMPIDTTDIEAARALLEKLTISASENNKRFTPKEVTALLSAELGKIVKECPWVVKKLRGEWAESQVQNPPLSIFGRIKKG